MKKSRFSKTQVALALRHAEKEIAAGEISRKLESSDQPYYRRRKNYGGPMSSEMNEPSMEPTREFGWKKLLTAIGRDSQRTQSYRTLPSKLIEESMLKGFSRII